MSLIKGRTRLFCVSNIIVSFACTGFFGTKYYTDSFELAQGPSNLDLTADEVIPLSRLGEGEKNVIEEITKIPNVEEIVNPAKKNNVQKKSANVKTSKNSTKVTNNSAKKNVTKSVVAKKEVKASVKYTPAAYNEVTGNAVIEYAKKYIGLRYVYAGKSLSTGTDCSGFTSLIYKEFGVSLPRTVSGQVRKGTYVKKSDLQKGDLVFYSSGGKTATHVGLYMGNGKVIHESNPKNGVKISSVNMMHYITARRVINSTAIKKVETNNVNTDTSKINNNVVNTNNVDNTSTESISNKDIQSKENVTGNQVNTSTETKQESEVIMDNKKENDSKEIVKDEVRQDIDKINNESIKETETKIDKSQATPPKQEVAKDEKVTDSSKEQSTLKEESVNSNEN